MRHRSITVVLAIGIGLSILMLAAGSGRFHLPDNQQGYEPAEQPIAFSHRLHAGELGIDCQYCHAAAAHGRHAGIPAVNTCMNCHRHVKATHGARRLAEEELAEKEQELAEKGEKLTEDEKSRIRDIVSPEIERIYDALALEINDDNKFVPIEGQEPKPISWVRVHNLPSFVFFDHRAHVGAGVDCLECHGPIDTMERVRQVSSLSMGWCVNCHRDVNEQGVNEQPVQASTDCDACHH